MQPEFTQLDLEMSFVDVEDIIRTLVEGAMAVLYESIKKTPLPVPSGGWTIARRWSAMARTSPTSVRAAHGGADPPVPVDRVRRVQERCGRRGRGGEGTAPQGEVPFPERPRQQPSIRRRTSRRAASSGCARMAGSSSRPS